MADFEYAFASAGTPNSFPIGVSGLVAIDASGLINPEVIILDPYIHVVITATKTMDEVAQVMLTWLRARGYSRESAGGIGPLARTINDSVVPALSEVGAAD